MAEEIKLTIVLPANVFLETKAASVILPAVRADVDILPSRAPSVFVLDYGVLQILTREGKAKERYFIKSGAAEIAGDACKVLTQEVISCDKITPHEAKKKIEKAANEDEKLFYEMILDYQRGIRRRYLRTLNVFADKSSAEKTYEENIAEIKANLEELRKKFPK